MTEGAKPQLDESAIHYECQRVTYGLPMGLQVSRNEVQKILIPKKFLEKAMAQAVTEELPFIAITPPANHQMYLDIREEVQQSQEHTPSQEGSKEHHGA